MYKNTKKGCYLPPTLRDWVNKTGEIGAKDLVPIETKVCDISCSHCYRTGFCPVIVYEHTNGLAMYRNALSTMYVIIARDNSVLLTIHKLNITQAANYRWAIQLGSIQTNTMKELFKVLSRSTQTDRCVFNFARDLLLVSQFGSFALNLKGVTWLEDLVKLYTDNIKRLTCDYAWHAAYYYENCISILRRVCGDDKKIRFKRYEGDGAYISSNDVTINLFDLGRSIILLAISTTKCEEEDILLIDAIDTMLAVYNSLNNSLGETKEKLSVYIPLYNTTAAKLTVVNVPNASLTYIGNSPYIEVQRELNKVYSAFRQYVKIDPFVQHTLNAQLCNECE